MKISISAVLSLLASVAVARPHAMEEGDPISETSRVTAFVISKDGTPSVECWEITNMINDQQIQRMDGSKGTARVVSLAAASELDGIDILTWPAYSPIWPIPGGVQSEWFDLSTLNNLFSVQGGLINFHFNFRVGSTTVAEPQEYVFSLENGDDWFYFEDNYSGSSLAADAGPSPFEIATISGSETEVINFRFPRQPKHKVIHKGACSFSGIDIPASPDQARSSYTKNSLVQQHGNSDL